MEKNVFLNIKAGISSEDGSEEIITTAKGSYYKQKDCEYVLYTEESEDGLSQKCRLKISDEELEMRKTGGYTAVMIFTRNKKTYTDYKTPYGMLSLEIDTKKLDYFVNSDEMKIRLEYLLNVNGGESSLHKMDIQIMNEK